VLAAAASLATAGIGAGWSGVMDTVGIGAGCSDVIGTALYEPAGVAKGGPVEFMALLRFCCCSRKFVRCCRKFVIVKTSKSSCDPAHVLSWTYI